MNILIFSTNSHYLNKPTGGAETSLRLIAEKFAAIGENVSYITGSTSKLPSIKRKVIKGVTVYFVSPFKWPSPKGGASYTLKLKFIRWQFRAVIRKLIQRKRIQIVHTYNEYPNTLDILTVRDKYNLNYKVVIRIAGLAWRNQCLKNPEIKRKIDRVFNSVDEIAFISEGLKTLFIKETQKLDMNITTKRQVVMDIGYDTNVFSRKWTYPKGSKFKIVMIARFSDYQKRQDLLIEAMSHLNNKNIELHFVGDGPNRESMNSLANSLKLNNNPIFHGFITQEEIETLLLGSHLFCMATDYEGLCKSIIEAMSVGIPVLASNVLSINSYIKDKSNGFLCDNDPRLWAKYISEIYEGMHNLERISENQVAFTSKNYDPDKNILLYRNEFKTLLDRSAATLG